MKKIFSIIAGLVLLSASAFCLESDFKNALLDVMFKQTAQGQYSIELLTQKPYGEPIKVIKKSDTNYYLLLPETKAQGGAVKPLGEITSAEVLTYPYVGQDLNNGYTKINIFTTGPIALSANFKSQTAKVATDTEKLAQLDNSFNKTQEVVKTQANTAQKAVTNAPLTKEQISANFEAQLKAKQQKASAQTAQTAQKAQTAAQKPAQAVKQTTQAVKTVTKSAQTVKQAAKPAPKAAKPAVKTQTVTKKPAAVATKPQQASKPAPQVAKPQVQQSKPTSSEQPKQVEEPIKEDIKPIEAPKPALNADEEPAIKLEQRHKIEEAKELEDKKALQAQNDDKITADKIKALAIRKIKEYKYQLAACGLIFGLLMLILMIKKTRKKEDKMEENKIQQEVSEAQSPFAKEPVDMPQMNEEQPFIQEFENFASETDAQVEEVQSPVALEQESEQAEDIQNIVEEIEQEETQAEQALDEVEQEDYIEPELLSSVEIEPNRGFMLIDQQGKKALFGYINDDVYLLYNFREFISNYDINFRVSEKEENKAFYIVKVDKVKLLVRVTPAEMKLELEM